MTIATIKYFDRDTLLAAAENSVKRDYNRAVSAEWLATKLDADMVYPITFSMVHEHIAGKAVDPHMRTIVALNAEGYTIQLDVDMDVYNALPSVEINRDDVIRLRQEEAS